MRIEERIARIAGDQYCVITLGQLVDAGFSVHAVGRQVRAGGMRRLHRGVFLLGPLMPPLAREFAAVLACGADALLCLWSARSLWELSPFADDQPVDVATPTAHRGRRPGIRAHRLSDLRSDERTVHRKIPVTTPARTLFDLASVLGTREFEQAVARAEREGLVTLPDLREMLNRHRGQPGTPALRALIEAEIGPQLSRSPLEAEFRDLVRRAGLPMPRMNVRMGPYELDAFWPDAHLAVEVDGFAYHSRRPRYEGDRVRDAWLLARGIQVLRLSARQIRNDPLPTAVLLAQTLTRASRNE